MIQKKAVLEAYNKYKGLFENMEHVLKEAAKDKKGNPLRFYNYSEYDFKALLEDPEHIEQNLMHYLDCFSGNVQDIFVFNPGGLVKWLKPEEFGTISKTRNPIIASLLARTIFVEKLGTGINRIRKAMESPNLPAPEFKFYEHSFYVNLFDKTMIKGTGAESQKTVEKTTQKIQNLSRKELLTLLENKVGSNLVEKVGSKLVENQLKIVLLILEDEKITKNRMSEILNISNT